MMHAKHDGSMASSARSAAVSIAECTMFAGDGVASSVCVYAVLAQDAGSLLNGGLGRCVSIGGITSTL
jgi:hypothetical protein